MTKTWMRLALVALVIGSVFSTTSSAQAGGRHRRAAWGSGGCWGSYGGGWASGGSWGSYGSLGSYGSGGCWGSYRGYGRHYRHVARRAWGSWGSGGSWGSYGSVGVSVSAGPRYWADNGSSGGSWGGSGGYSGSYSAGYASTDSTPRSDAVWASPDDYLNDAGVVDIRPRADAGSAEFAESDQPPVDARSRTIPARPTTVQSPRSARNLSAGDYQPGDESLWSQQDNVRRYRAVPRDEVDSRNSDVMDDPQPPARRSEKAERPAPRDARAADRVEALLVSSDRRRDVSSPASGRDEFSGPMLIEAQPTGVRFDGTRAESVDAEPEVDAKAQGKAIADTSDPIGDLIAADEANGRTAAVASP